jgi:hypothetical protein
MASEHKPTTKSVVSLSSATHLAEPGQTRISAGGAGHRCHRASGAATEHVIVAR